MELDVIIQNKDIELNNTGGFCFLSHLKFDIYLMQEDMGI